MYPKRLLIQKRRNEYGRKIRKQYESKQTNATRNEVVDYRFYQYPRGVNRGGVLQSKICPTISCSSWQHNCLLVCVYKKE